MERTTWRRTARTLASGLGVVVALAGSPAIAGAAVARPASPPEPTATVPTAPVPTDGELAAAAEASPDGGVAMFTVARADGGVVVERLAAPSADAAEAVVDAVAADADTLAVSVDEPVQALEATTAGPVGGPALLGATDPARYQQWALDVVRFEATWPMTAGGGVKVAVIDTGVNGAHVEFGGRVLPGIDLVGTSDGRYDPNGHGTHVAGIIAAGANDGRGIAGGAPQVQILPVRALNVSGSGMSSDVSEGIIWATDQGTRVINLSLGGTSPSAGQLSAIQYARARGVVVLAAAGNNGQSGNPPIYPGAFAESVAVSSITNQRVRSPFSNWGGYVDLAAPGSSILSTYKGSTTAYATMSGTSMATPYASAAAALVVAARPSATNAEVEQALLATADDLGPIGRDAEYGAGLVDPFDAVRMTLGGGGGNGYWVTSIDGSVVAFGSAIHYGDLAGKYVGSPIVAAAPTRSGRGYWLASAAGGVYAFGDAPFYGSAGSVRLNQPIIGMAVTPSGHGYYLLGRDGGIFTFGDARFHGSTGGIRLNQPVLDMAVTASGNGYWLVAADGGIFTFGDASFFGSTGGLRLNQPVTSITASPDGRGYLLVAGDGGIFTFGSTRFFGSIPSLGLAAAVGQGARIRALPENTGYYILTRDGAVFTFGAAPFHGATVGRTFGNQAVDFMLQP